MLLIVGNLAVIDVAMAENAAVIVGSRTADAIGQEHAKNKRKTGDGGLLKPSASENNHYLGFHSVDCHILVRSINVSANDNGHLPPG